MTDTFKLLTILPVPTLKDNYVWVMIDADHHTALVIDPGEAKPVIAFLKQQHLTLIGILITHHHWDHTNGIAELKNNDDVPVYGSENEKVMTITQLVREPDKVSLPNFPTFHVMAIPGHTLLHIAYYAKGLLFCGDTLFAAGCGRLFEGTALQMYTTLQKIASLPDETRIYCAHEYTLDNLRFAATVEPGNQQIAERFHQVSELRKQHLPSLPSVLSIEKETNPFLRCDSPELIANVEKYAGQKLNKPVDVFTWLRKWKDNFS
jgi:hydroxyacylglutathione hydrolase